MNENQLVETFESFGDGVLMGTAESSSIHARVHVLRDGVVVLYDLDPDESPRLIRYEAAFKTGPGVALQSKDAWTWFYPLDDVIDPTFREQAAQVQISRPFAQAQFEEVS